MDSQNETAIEIVLTHFDQRRANKIRPILYANLIRGRIDTFLSNDSHTLEEYIEIVAENYQAMSDYLYQLQVTRSKKIWQELMVQIHQWGYAWFQRQGYLDQETGHLVGKAAENTALEILLLPFPYDVDFDVWAMVVVEKNSRRLFSREGGELLSPPQSAE